MQTECTRDAERRQGKPNRRYGEVGSKEEGG